MQIAFLKVCATLHFHQSQVKSDGLELTLFLVL